MKDKNLIVPWTHLILMKDERILLSKRKDTWYHDGEYGAVAWHVEQWESFIDATIREAKEEIGIGLKPNQLRMIHVQNKKQEWYNYERIHIYFVATEREGEIKNMEPNKCEELSRFNMKDLPENILDCVKASIENINNKVMYSEFWR